MALSATVLRIEVDLSDVDRGVYESLDLRVALHPSESMRFLVTRVLAYALSYEEGIAFSKGGLSSADEAPLSVHDATGVLLARIDIGAPSAERLHKASKAARRVAVFTHVEFAQLRRELASKSVHRAEQIELTRIPVALLDAIAAKIDRHAKLAISRNEDILYITIGSETLEGTLERAQLLPEAG